MDAPDIGSKGIDHADTAASKRRLVMRCHERFHRTSRRLTGCLAILAALFSSVAFAQSGYYWVPLVAVEGIYDDNIFFDAENEVSDTIIRLSPQLDVGYESQTLSWLLSFRNDAEWYNDLSDLDSSTARQFGVGRIEYDANRRLTLRGDAEYTNTNTVQDLTLTPGGGIPGRVGRAEAERLYFAAGADYQFSPQFTGVFDISWIEDDLEDVSENETLALNVGVEQVLRPTRSLLYNYEYRDYDFTNRPFEDPDFVFTNSEDSHTLWLGWREQLSERSRLEVRAGPRFADDADGSSEVDPYFLFNWNRDYDRGNFGIEGLWDETTIIGAVGRIETQSIYATWSHEFSADFEVTGNAGYAWLEQSGDPLIADESDIATFEIAGIYRFNRYIFMTARYGYNSQDLDNAFIGLSETISHGIASLAITFTRPRPGTVAGTP